MRNGRLVLNDFAFAGNGEDGLIQWNSNTLFVYTDAAAANRKRVGFVPLSNPTTNSLPKFNASGEFVEGTLRDDGTNPGSTAATWDLSIGGTGVRLKNNTGVLQLRNLADNAYADLTAKDVTITGNLTVSGTTITMNTETVTIDDNIIVLNNNEAGTPSVDAGIQIERGTSTNASITWDETADVWKAGLTGSEVELVTLTGTQILTNKVLTLPQINDSAGDHQYVFAVANLAADRTVSLPLLAGNDTFVFEAFAQALSNKTISSSVLSGGALTMTLGSDGTGDIYYRSAGGFLTRLAAASDGDVLTLASGLPSWDAPTGGTPPYTDTFVDADLTASVLTVVHGLSGQYHHVTVYDDNDQIITPDKVVASSGTDIDIYLNSYGTLVGTWKVKVS